MAPELFGIEHILYILISTILGAMSLIFARKYAKTEKAQSIFLKILATALFISVMTNRVSQVFRYDTVRWYCIIPDSFCAMTSLVLSLAVLFGKKDNNIYILFENYIYKYDVKSDIYQKMVCSSGAEDILISSDDSIIVCYPSYAINFDF